MINIVDFYADWCGPCQRLKPVLEEIESERNDVSVEYVNIDENMARAQESGVSSLPTIIFEKNGVEYKRLQGAVSKQKILDIIDS